MTRAEQDELILEHLPMSEKIAGKIYRHIGRRIPLDDLKQYGAVGLVMAAAHFDPSKGWKFNTFAEYRIKGAIIDGIRRENRTRVDQDYSYELVALDIAILIRSDATAEHDFRAIEARIDTDRLTQRLPKAERIAVGKVFLEEKHQDEAGREMGRHQTGVSKLLTAAFARMAVA